MSEPATRREASCPLCTFHFPPDEQACHPGCPISSGCTFLCCPRCGYHFLDEERSTLVRWWKRLTRKGVQHAE